MCIVNQQFAKEGGRLREDSSELHNRTVAKGRNGIQTQVCIILETRSPAMTHPVLCLLLVSRRQWTVVATAGRRSKYTCVGKPVAVCVQFSRRRFTPTQRSLRDAYGALASCFIMCLTGVHSACLHDFI